MEVDHLAQTADYGSVTAVGVTKTQNSDTVIRAIKAGITVVGENRVQELLAKHRDGAYDGANLHFIGHLQRNKVRDIIDKVDMIQSLDSLRLAEVVDSEAKRIGCVMDVLLQVKMGDEDSKYGFPPKEIMSTFGQISRFKNLKIRGLMTIPPPSNGVNRGNLKFFSKMRQIYVDIREQSVYTNSVNSFDVLSMGMSDDYRDAIAAGATMVRLGSVLFGQRE